jgi:hypothetical protein
MKLTHVVCMVGIVLGTHVARAQSKYDYLHQTTNEILQIERGSMKMTPEEAGAIATRACKTLERLLGDPNFAQDVKKLAADTGKHSAYHRKLAGDVMEFVDAFIPEERDALRNANLSPRAVSQIVLLATSVRSSLNDKPDPGKIMSSLDALRKEICAAATAFVKSQDDEKGRQQRLKTIRRWGLGLAGLSLIAADAAATVPSGGVATASFTLGGAAVGAAVADASQ